MSHIRRLLPVLTDTMRKGSCGKLAVIGGSIEYTGAPYFAAITALRLGADLMHVFCPPDAAVVIKGYSPDLMVHPSVDPSYVIDNLSRMDAIVLGPGLGRDPARKQLVSEVLRYVADKGLPTVIDADGLWFLGDLLSTTSVVMPSVIITPNKVEFSRLCASALGKHDVLQIEDSAELFRLADRLSRQIGMSVFLKGVADYITNPDGHSCVSSEPGSLRRCGGQGDTSSGSLALFLLWAKKQSSIPSEAVLLAGLASSQLVRSAARRAFEKIGRSMTTSDVIEQIAPILKELDDSTH